MIDAQKILEEILKNIKPTTLRISYIWLDQKAAGPEYQQQIHTFAMFGFEHITIATTIEQFQKIVLQKKGQAQDTNFQNYTFKNIVICSAKMIEPFIQSKVSSQQIIQPQPILFCSKTKKGRKLKEKYPQRIKQFATTDIDLCQMLKEKEKKLSENIDSFEKLKTQLTNLALLQPMIQTIVKQKPKQNYLWIHNKNEQKMKFVEEVKKVGNLRYFENYLSFQKFLKEESEKKQKIIYSLIFESDDIEKILKIKQEIPNEFYPYKNIQKFFLKCKNKKQMKKTPEMLQKCQIMDKIFITHDQELILDKIRDIADQN